MNCGIKLFLERIKFHFRVLETFLLKLINQEKTLFVFFHASLAELSREKRKKIEKIL